MNSIQILPPGYTWPPVVTEPGPHGPEQLGDVMRHDRDYEIASRGGDEALAPPISSDGIRRLLLLVFYTSTISEEGR